MKRLLCVLTFGWCLTVMSGPAVAAVDNTPVKITRGQFFDVYGYRGLDIGILYQKLHLDRYISFDTFFAPERPDPYSLLAEAMDALYLDTGRILGVSFHEFRGTIMILPDQRAVNAEFRKITDGVIREPSFYWFENNTIYISFADMNLEMMGHEMAHALMSHYFIVPPPDKIQEILSGYVEYHLKKASDMNFE